MADRTQNHNLDDDSLLQIFSCYRLEDEDNWYLRLSWLTLVHVCRKWRYLIYGSWSYLDVCHLITHNSTSMDPPGHLPHLPLVIACSDRTKTMTRSGEDNIHLGLQYGGRIRRVSLRAPSLSLRMWFERMNKQFPRLQYLSLFSTTTEDMSLVLPELLQAPELRHLSLHGVGLPKRLALLSSMNSLSTLSLTHIRGSCYFPPGHLVTQLQGLPYLEELSVGIALPIPLSISEGKLFPSPTSPVLLRTLKRLTFRGEDGYLDDLVARINTPHLKRLDLTLLFDLAFTLVNLTEFIHRTEGFRCLVAQVIFNKGGAYIDTDMSYHEEQDNWKLSLYVNCESVDWKIHSAAQVCSALEKVLSSVEELTLDLDEDGMPSDWKNKLSDGLWHDLLLPFIGAKKLHIGPSLTLEISQGLESLDGALVLDLLPKLEELEVPLALEFGLAQTAFSMFVETRGSVGRPVHRLPPFLSPELRCRLCRRLSPRREVEHLGGFCSERHKWDWEKGFRSTTSTAKEIEARDWFFAVDQDGDGVLSPDELCSGLLTNGYTRFKADTVKYLMNTFDPDSNGVITFDEFEPLWDDMNLWIQMFDSFDDNEDGIISTAELGRALAHYGLHLSPDVLDMVMEKYGDVHLRNRQQGYGGLPGPHMNLDNFVSACVGVRKMCDLHRDCSPQGQPWMSRDAFLKAVLSFP